MRISGLEWGRHGDRDVLSGSLGDFRLCYQFPAGGATNAKGDAFVVAGLLAAMARGELLELDEDYTASPLLLQRLDRLQEIFTVWVPELRRVPVKARPAASPAPRSATASFFSGGVDSLYTFLEKEPEIRCLLHIRGFDYRRENRPLVEEIDGANQRFAEARGRTYAVVESNLRDLYDSLRVHVYLYHGCHLASVGLAAGFSRIYVPSTLTWAQLLPWGSHPLTDPLWGTDAVEFTTQGAGASRVEKLRRIGQDPDALGLLRVCASNTAYSCASCEKCLRTRAGLRVLGLASSRLPRLEDTGAVRRLRLQNEFQRFEWEQNYERAVGAGDRALASAIAVVLARYQARLSVVSLDRLLLGGRLRRGFRYLKGVVRGQDVEPPKIRIDRQF